MKAKTYVITYRMGKGERKEQGTAMVEADDVRSAIRFLTEERGKTFFVTNIYSEEAHDRNRANKKTPGE